MRVKLRQAIEDNLAGQPRAQSYDTSTGSGSVWCWTHEREAAVCHRNDEMCDGEAMATIDPTGEAAVSGDKARADQTELARLEKILIDTTDRLARLADRYLPDRLPTGADRAKLATPGEPGCHWCETQAKTWAPPTTKEASTVAGNLPSPVLCCRSHYDFIRTIGRAPTPAETQSFHRKGRWPKQKAA